MSSSNAQLKTNDIWKNDQSSSQSSLNIASRTNCKGGAQGASCQDGVLGKYGGQGISRQDNAQGKDSELSTGGEQDKDGEQNEVLIQRESGGQTEDIQQHEVDIQFEGSENENET